MAALNSVQNRQRELHSLQESVVELAQLYKQLEQMISDQDVAFQAIEAGVVRAENDIEKGHSEVGVALVHGYSARRVSACNRTIARKTPAHFDIDPFELITHCLRPSFLRYLEQVDMSWYCRRRCGNYRGRCRDPDWCCQAVDQIFTPFRRPFASLYLATSIPYLSLHSLH